MTASAAAPDARNDTDGPPSRVVIIDDHDVIVDALANRIERTPDLELVGAAATGEQGLALVDQVNPDAVILDLGLPDIKGMDVCEQMRRAHPDLAIVILTAYSDPKHVLAAEEAGASAFLSKEAKGKEIMRIVEHAISYPTSFFAVDLPEIRRTALPNAEPKLTSREIRLLELVAHGHTMMDAGEQVGLSDRTARVSLSRAYAKLGANNAPHAVYLALKDGLIQ